MVKNSSLLLSAIVVVGPCRTRAQRVINALYAQTVVESIEIIVIDLAPSGTPTLETAPGVRVTYLSRPEMILWSRARVEGVQHAQAPIVAFIEDHCFPEPGWAEALIEAHQGPWGAVGYGFTNANPETYMSRACMVNDYGYWLHPARRGQASILPGQNVSYKRDLLLAFGARLELLLTPDFNLQQALSKQNLPMFVESRALAAHENFIRLSALMQAHYAYARLLAARRAEVLSWSRIRRIFYGLAVLPGAPVIAIARLILGLRGRASLWPAVMAAFPIYVLTRLWAAIGESLGYLLGQGSVERKLHRWELEVERTITP